MQASPAAPQACEVPTFPPAMEAAPTQLCHLCSSSHVALAEDPLSGGIPANLLMGRCSFHKAAVKTKKTKTLSLFYTHRVKVEGERNEGSLMDSSGSPLQDQAMIFPLAAMLSLNVMLCSIPPQKQACQVSTTEHVFKCCSG